MPFIKRYFTWLLVFFCLVFALQMWLCSGTLAPYAATLANPHLVNDQGDYISIEGDTDFNTLGCYYIANYDHKHYIANYKLIDGKPKEEWNWAYLLRRPLLYMVSYPFMKMFGFTGGGFVMAIVLNIAALVWFCLWAKKRWGETASFVGLVLLSAYPATMYWSGMPYPHILITACTLVLTILLYKVWETRSLRKTAVYSLLAGISFLAYDTYIFFIPAFGLLLLLQKKVARHSCINGDVGITPCSLAMVFKRANITAIQRKY
ncbi:glycosyltransferase family 39 protein [Oscillatoria amoena NRMC-F 0135]|nr:glycosyltransferase family 39 protein [Oscillatoria amoena NRMC-F 0135]